MRPPATKGNKKKDKLGDKIGDKTSGRHTIQHPGGHLKKALRTPNSTLFEKKCKIRPPATKGNKKKDKLGDKLGDKKEDKLGDELGDREGGQPSNTGTNVGRQWETRGDKTFGRGTHRPTGHKKETRPREGGQTIQQRETRRETRGDKGRQDPREGGHTIQH